MPPRPSTALARFIRRPGSGALATSWASKARPTSR
ncbi:hypothetical protein MGSAQ_003213 [marine sediment metagenome]|uniref:Uncharacterized protein n=1 Tax=marine sediment metagenome TaxID=412755 RepID=A0A1B6NQK8_9ZZZZ